MTGSLSNGQLQRVARAGWSVACPRCAETFRYTLLQLAAAEPYLHCDRCSNFVLRAEDAAAVAKAAGPGELPTVAHLRHAYDELERTLEPCPCGGRFSRWANVKCPGCRREIPYAGGVRDEGTRYFEGKVVWVESAIHFPGPTAAAALLARVDA